MATLTLSLGDFRAQHTPGRRRSALESFAADLVQLLEDGYSFRQLLGFLAGNGVNTCLSNLHGFIARWRRRHAPRQVTAEQSAQTTPTTAPALEEPVARPSQRAPLSPATSVTPAMAAASPVPQVLSGSAPSSPPTTAPAPFSIKAIRAERHNLHDYAMSYRQSRAGGRDSSGK